jgi:hypothetical protein
MINVVEQAGGWGQIFCSKVLSAEIEGNLLVASLGNGNYKAIANDMIKAVELLCSLDEQKLTFARNDIRHMVSVIETGIPMWKYCLKEWRYSDRRLDAELYERPCLRQRAPHLGEPA